ncbi:type I-G CRISPR-associated helicase/endonuclease Cas3g [Methylomonas fluvii]|uniref:CRISPR-associated helicase Cas3 n=1 Tax=Methylomonas fluvii TaxID=1854564 RepID=A0ABR9DCM6_9GAMM|nr:CRISPR-associated helicase Cas3' [Methylomonas fluvii]MBD9360536.1 CRISPR-associated helicase Cas3' [Methylomonas fluvii]
MSNYSAFFRQATLLAEPFPYQQTLAQAAWPDFLEIPTGLGKTAAIMLAWLYKRQVAHDADTPRRLVYCLPMRVLVEQTQANIESWLERLNLRHQVNVHILMGGEDGQSWVMQPEKDTILIGTQDMLLSRALMRGYGVSRYQWPVHFALLHNDALWVFDEVQLMGAGLSTSAQVEAFRRTLTTSVITKSLWVSATLNRNWLNTVDFSEYLPKTSSLALSETEQALPTVQQRVKAIKRLSKAACLLSTETKKNYVAQLSELVSQQHQVGTNSLVIVNRVERAQQLYAQLKKQKPAAELLLVHARFRLQERRQLNQRLQQAAPEAGRIIIATQAIEAGVDISSKTLFTEIAPWSSLVQRFGRCNRYGEYNEAGGADIFWIDIEDDTLPYAPEDFELSRSHLLSLESAAPSELPKVTTEQAIHPVLRKKDFLDLFNTDADLSGFDTDISQFIRDQGMPQLRVFWRDIEKPQPDEPQPLHSELCPVSMGQIKDYFKDKERAAFVWDGLAKIWKKIDQPFPGMTLLLPARYGGYDLESGFDPTKKQAVPITLLETTQTDESYTGDQDSRKTKAIELPAHLRHVFEHAQHLLDQVHAQASGKHAVVTAAAWHDVGKSHKVFQHTMLQDDRLSDEKLWAKSAANANHQRRYFRHELASMLAWLLNNAEHPQRDLIAYLIVAHHGKVRLSLRAMPDEKPPKDKPHILYARGVYQGDCLPEVAVLDQIMPATELRLELMQLGETEVMGPSWTTRTQTLLREHGPFELAWYETLVRIADWRASEAEQQDGTENPQ